MGKQVLVLVGTQKGAFFFSSDQSRASWKMSGPHLAGWDIYSFYGDGRSGRIWAGTSHYAYGPTFRVTDDFGASWRQLEARPQYPADTGWKLNRIWQITPHPTDANTLFAGVEEAGLFVTRDRGQSWNEVTSLTRQPGRSKWFPGNGGLCLHTILIHPVDPQRMWVGISAVGIFRTEDGGASWKSLNKTLPVLATGSDDASAVCCVHKMVLDPRDPNTVYMQYHGGVFKSTTGGEDWKPIELGLPGNFGFPLVISPKGELFVVPLAGDEQRFFKDGRAAVYRSGDAGSSWQAKTSGLPAEPYFAGVLRDAMAADPLNPAGIYVGTTMGDLFYSLDAGENWQQMPGRFPRISTVKTMVTEA